MSLYINSSVYHCKQSKERNKLKENYLEHFLMNLEDVKKFVHATTNFFDDDTELSSVELSDGNINYVYRVFDEKRGTSLIVKQADIFLRSSGRPLDVHRSKIEMDVLKLQAEYCPEYVPKIYHYSEEMSALIMEDLGNFENLRLGLMKENVFMSLAEDISTFIVNTQLPSTDLVLDRHIKKLRVQNFINVELCDISEDLVFTEPYYNYKNRNIITKGQESYVNSTLYNDIELHAEIAQLRNNFMNNAQSLLHGDLHTGSIFANRSGIKIIDPEFAFYGPMGYDIGNVLANMIFALANKTYLKNDAEEFTQYLKKTITEIFDLTQAKLYQKYDEIVQFKIYKNEAFQNKYIAGIISDSIGYAGTEMIRRVVGDSKVIEVNDVTDLTIKLPLERCLIELGVALIKNRASIKSGQEIINLYNRMVEKNKV